jgi:hypothetical protein
VSVVIAGGAPRPFIVAGGGHTGAGEGEMAGSSSAPLGRETRGEAASSEGANQKGKRIPLKT